MERYFRSVQVIDVDKRAAWYICRQPLEEKMEGCEKLSA